MSHNRPKQNRHDYGTFSKPNQSTYKEPTKQTLKVLKEDLADLQAINEDRANLASNPKDVLEKGTDIGYENMKYAHKLLGESKFNNYFAYVDKHHRGRNANLKQAWESYNQAYLDVDKNQKLTASEKDRRKSRYIEIKQSLVETYRKQLDKLINEKNQTIKQVSDSLATSWDEIVKPTQRR